MTSKKVNFSQGTYDPPISKSSTTKPSPGVSASGYAMPHRPDDPEKFTQNGQIRAPTGSYNTDTGNFTGDFTGLNAKKHGKEWGGRKSRRRGRKSRRRGRKSRRRGRK